jgi:hypothetical protein
VTVAPRTAGLARIFRTLVSFHIVSFSGFPFRFLVAFQGGDAGVVQPASDRPKALIAGIAVEHLGHDRLVLGIGLVPPSPGELHRAVPEGDLTARVLAVADELVVGIADAGGDRLALELGEGRCDRCERAPGRRRQIEHRVDAEQRLALGFKPGHERHEVEQRPRESVELRYADRVPHVEAVVPQPWS